MRSICTEINASNYNATLSDSGLDYSIGGLFIAELNTTADTDDCLEQVIVELGAQAVVEATSGAVGDDLAFPNFIVDGSVGHDGAFTAQTKIKQL